MINKLYEVVITETLKRSVFVEATTPESAEALVEQLYNESEIILDSDDYDDTEIEVFPAPVDRKYGFEPDYFA